MPRDEIEKELRASFQDYEYAHAYAEDFCNAFIATQIKVLREDRNLTQAQLAELAGMKQSRISVMEDVNYGAWSLKTLRRLAAALDLALTVNFESFSKLISDVGSFSRESLRRPSRPEDIDRFASHGEDAVAKSAVMSFENQGYTAQSAANASSTAIQMPSASALDTMSSNSGHRRSRDSALRQWPSHSSVAATRSTALGVRQ